MGWNPAKLVPGLGGGTVCVLPRSPRERCQAPCALDGLRESWELWEYKGRGGALSLNYHLSGTVWL